MYRILSLSGGGIRGIFQAACLNELANLRRENPLSRSFDLVAGTSTGAIVAMGVALSVDLGRLVDLFRTVGRGSSISDDFRVSEKARDTTLAPFEEP